METLLVIVMWLLLGWATAHLAEQRGRRKGLWFALGAFFGVFAIIGVLIAGNTDERIREIANTPNQ